MAIKLIGTKKLPTVIGDEGCEVLTAKEFICDTDADFDSLPECCVSSSAVSIESGKVYVVNVRGKWQEFGLPYLEKAVGTWMFKHTIEKPSKNFKVEFTENLDIYEGLVYENEGLYYSHAYPDTSMRIYNFYGDSIGWNDIGHARIITITKECTDRDFVIWLNKNAVRTDIDNSIIGKWVFNEKLTPINKPFDFVYEPIDIYGVIYGINDKNAMPFDRLNFTANDDGDMLEVYCMDDDAGEELVCELGIDEHIWYIKTREIIFITGSADFEFVEWLKANATKVEENETDMANTISGTWYFNETIDIPGKPFEVSFASIYNDNYTVIEFGDRMFMYYSTELGDETYPIYSSFGWEYNTGRIITILEEHTDPEFIAWLKKNATKVG